MSTSFWGKEPISLLIAAAIAVINAGIQVLIAFGLAITPAQGVAVGGFVSAVIAIVGVIMRSQVSPTAVIAPALSAISDFMDNGELRAAWVGLDQLTAKVDPDGKKSGSALPPAPPAIGGLPPEEPPGARPGMLRWTLALAAAFALALGLPGCTPSQGQTAATIIAGACGIGSVVIPGAAGFAPLCADVGLVEKIIEEWNHPTSPTMAHAPGPIPVEELYKRALAGGAKPIAVSK